MDDRSAPCKALVLAGGGARGSYQVGVWRALMELDWHPQIITGTSVGSLNGAMFVLDPLLVRFFGLKVVYTIFASFVRILHGF